MLGILGPEGRVSLSAEEESELTDALQALPTTAATLDNVKGSWRLLYTSKSDFDVTNPLGRRVDGTAPGVEAVFDSLFSKPDAASSSSPVQRLVTSTGVKILQNVEDDRVDQIVLVNDANKFRLSASAEFDKGRLLYTFDLAYFQIGGVRIPYPVPFKLLGDEAKGWLDTIYVSPRLRVSKGNKGTTFILAKQ